MASNAELQNDRTAEPQRLIYRTHQEVFDAVKDHLLKQGAKCMIGGSCAYFDPDGQRCAIGALMDREVFNRHRAAGVEFYGLSATSPEVREVLIESGVSNDLWNSWSFWLDLQDIHDNYPVEEWPDGLQEFAENYGLNY